MPGEQLMCVWQAVLSKDVFPESGVKRATVMSVVENFAHIRNVVYTERRFQEVFTESKVRLLLFSSFLKANTRTSCVEKTASCVYMYKWLVRVCHATCFF